MCMSSSCTWPFYSLCVSPVFSPFFFFLSIYCVPHQNFLHSPELREGWCVYFSLSNHMTVLNSKEWKEKKKKTNKHEVAVLNCKHETVTTAVSWKNARVVSSFFSSPLPVSGSLCIVLWRIRCTLFPFVHCTPFLWMRIALAIIINCLKSGACQRENVCRGPIGASAWWTGAAPPTDHNPC